MGWLWLLIPDSAASLVIMAIAMALLLGLVRPRTAVGWLLTFLVSLAAGPIIESIVGEILDALPLWIVLLIVLGVVLTIARAVLSLMLGPHAADHIIGTLFIGFLKLLWGAVALPFRALAWLCRHRRLAAIAALLFAAGDHLAYAGQPVVRGAARAVGRKIVGRGLAGARAFDWKRDALTPLRRLSRPRTVQRFTSASEATLEKRTGVAAGSHFTAGAAKGRPLSAVNAARRFGLVKPPRVRETVILPKGFPVKANKVAGGAPGFGELKSGDRLAGNAIRKIVPLPRKR